MPKNPIPEKPKAILVDIIPPEMTQEQETKEVEAKPSRLKKVSKDELKAIDKDVSEAKADKENDIKNIGDD